TNRTASCLKSSVYCRRVFVRMRSSNFIIFLLLEVSVKSGKGQLEIAKKAKEALLQIGNESLLNKIRLKKFGISTVEDQVGAEPLPHPPPVEE
ncbi:MAG: hypothetical protein AB7P24_08970, partial [Nitrospira sp.]